ncbi:sulfur relay (sulfurtransferase) DsrC/TusE family protein [Methanococcus maripaludis]|uniref:Sulfur relay (Sulfurtransferase) DsrC/TusE family protein n=1 Tax=Methanococcus maripaludis TaxID=39152 RepID=A0A7J9NWN9_METMI|nr:hypothetical protein [Methanococcus maripaludis]MBA2851737.1 sulfur relay (sulfurtransferase) DsrC/TusE family protein [Methanococcus maripaludis]
MENVDRKKVLGLYGVLAPYHGSGDTVYVPKYMRTVDGKPVKNGMTAIVWRYPVVSKNAVIKLTLQVHDENVIRVPVKYISSLDGDYDGDCVACMAIDDNIPWVHTDYIVNNYSTCNTDIDLSLSKFKSSKRAGSFLDVLLTRNTEMWTELYDDATNRDMLTDMLPKLPGAIFKHLIGMGVGKYQVISNYIVYNHENETEIITNTTNTLNGKTDIWVSAVHNVMAEFYKQTLNTKHPNVKSDLRDMYKFYNLVFGDIPRWFIDETGITYPLEKVEVAYFYDKFFNGPQKSNFDVVLHGLKNAKNKQMLFESTNNEHIHITVPTVNR